MKKQLTILIICIIAISLTLGCTGLNNPYDPELTGEWETTGGTWDFDGLGNFSMSSAMGTYDGVYTTNANTLTLSVPSAPGFTVGIANYQITGNQLVVTPIDPPASEIILYRKGTQPTFDPELTGAWVTISAAGPMEYYFDGRGRITLYVISGNHLIEDGTYTTHNGILTRDVYNHTNHQNEIYTSQYSIYENTLTLISESGQVTTYTRPGTQQTGSLMVNVTNVVTGHPVGNAVVRIGRAPDIIHERRTNSSGSINVNLKNGDYIVTVDAYNYESSSQYVTVNGETAIEVALTPISNPTNLELRHNQVFPYDATATTNPAWRSTIDTVATGIAEVTIYNDYAFNQSKIESQTSKLMLAKGESLEMPLNLAEVTYNGNLDFNTGMISKVGQDALDIIDQKGIARLVPYVISLSNGTNYVQIGGKTFKVEIDNQNEEVTYNGQDWFITQPFIDNTITLNPLKFIIDVNWDSDGIEYVLGADKTTGQYWLFLKSQIIPVKNGTLTFSGTQYVITAGTNAYINFYLPDIATYNILTIPDSPVAPSEGDNIAFTAEWTISEMILGEVAGTEYVYVFQNTSNGHLIDTTDGKVRLMHMTDPVRYNNPPVANEWLLNHTTTSYASRLLKGITEYGIIVEIENNEAIFRIPTTQSIYTITASKNGSNSDNLAQELDLRYRGASGAVVETYANDSQFETLNYGGIVTLQTIADGFNPGNVLLNVPHAAIRYRIVFNDLIRFGTNTGQVIDISGTSYLVVEATQTKLVLEFIG